VQFAADSCSFLGDAVRELGDVFRERTDQLARAEAGTLDLASLLASIRDSNASHDVDYIIEQLPLATERAREGLERVSAIVKAMKEFAYTHHSERIAVDLNRAIQSTLVVARNEYKYVADVQVELGELPLVTCNGGEVNQVLLNIVVNAAHAIEAKHGGGESRGTITIRTAAADGHAVVDIRDDGCGIPRAIIDKIFDPFFTTKEIGKGSGQGLAIARSVIVDKHRGKLDVASEPGAGTTFTIRIPIDGEVATAVRDAA
jgi:signal transduction histidine kinase